MAGDPIWVIAVAHIASVQIHLAGNRLPALHLCPLHRLLHAHPAISWTQIRLTLCNGIHGRIGSRIESAPAGYAGLHRRKGGVPLIFEIRLRSATDLVEHLGAGNLRKACNLVEGIAARELYPGSDSIGAEGAGELGNSAYAGRAIGIGEVSPALEEAGEGVVAAAGGGLEEAGGGGLGDEGVEESCYGLLEGNVAYSGLPRAALVDQAKQVRSCVWRGKEGKNS